MNKGALFRTAALIASGILLTLPALIYGFPEITDDATQHVLYIRSFSQQFWAGELYPRWLSEMNAGLGSPTFFYYPPLSYVITSLIKPLTPFWLASNHGWGLLGLSSCLAVTLSGICMYRWLRELVDPWPAFAASLLYMLMPYHVAVDLYTRGAFAELWGFVWMPLTLFFTSRIAKGRPFAMAGLAVAYAALITTHLPTTVIFSAVPVVYVVFGRVATERRTVVIRVVVAMVLGIGLASIFLLPALGTTSYVHLAHLNEVTKNYFNYENWFLFSKLKLWGDETSKLSVMLLFVIVPMLGAIYLAFANRNVRRELLLFTGISAVSVFMMVSASKPIWKLLPPLQAIQFPYRINNLVSVSAATLLALGFSSLKLHRRKVNLLIVAEIIACVCVWMTATVLAARSAFLRFNPLPEYAARVDHELSLSIGGFELWPRNTVVGTQEQTLTKVANGDLSPRARVVEGTGTVAVRDWRPRSILLSMALQTDSVVHLNQLYFPGHTAKIVGREVSVPIQPTEAEGLISVVLPAGNYDVSLTLEPGVYERAGQTISTVAAFGVLLLILYEWSLRKRRRKLTSFSVLTIPEEIKSV